MSWEIFLETERLFLRVFTLSDAPLLYALDSDPDVMRFISKGTPTPLEKIVNTVLPGMLRYYETHDHLGFWAAHERASGDFIGWFHLKPDRFVPEAIDLGYRLMRRCWGRGFATEGSRALIDKAFTVWDIDRVIAHTLVGNAASQRVMEKCGLRFERRFTYPESLLPGWTLAERQAVRYGLDNAAYRGASGGPG
jgi:RimJ/RimL family protein N-acetyltransferase